MAIYDVDSIMESGMDTDDVLDNMLEACDQMMSAIGESGGAHQKYAKMLAKQDKDIQDKMEKIKYTGSGSKHQENLLNKYADERYRLAKKAARYVDDGLANSYASTDVAEKNRRSKHGKPGYGYIDGYAKAKENFAKDFGGPGGEDKLAAKQKRHDEMAAKKRAIKETCLNILSVIDEL